MQALERAAPTLPMRPGQVERQEADYVRHGTQALTANFEVATGRVVCPTVGRHPDRGRLRRPRPAGPSPPTPPPGGCSSSTS